MNKPVTFTSSIAAAYWREEIRLNSPALERLKRICVERQADYAATVAALIASGIAMLNDGVCADQDERPGRALGTNS
jgi:hypothetical protein